MSKTEQMIKQWYLRDGDMTPEQFEDWKKSDNYKRLVEMLEEYRQQAPGMRWRCGTEFTEQFPFRKHWREKETQMPSYAKEIAEVFSTPEKAQTFLTHYEFLDESTPPVQLPTEEEIEAAADQFTEPTHYKFEPSERYGFIEGAKWMLSKLKGGSQ